MQYKKDEVKKKLLEAGEEEFYLYGFKDSSVRRLVKAAGTTIGNFYNYFSNKEEIFGEVVGSELKQFNNFINSHEIVDDADFLFNETDITVWDKVLEDSVGMFMPVFTKRFYILIACSGGTAYENAREQVLEYIKTHFVEHALENGSIVKNIEDMARVLAHEFLEGILFIIKNHGEGSVAETLIKNHILFFFMGIMGILKGPKGRDEV